MDLPRQYNAAVDSLATASVGERLEVMSKGERFSLIEPAVAPSAPDEPNRLLIASAGLAGGIGAGLGFILIAAVAFFPVVRTLWLLYFWTKPLMSGPTFGCLARTSRPEAPSDPLDLMS